MPKIKTALRVYREDGFAGVLDIIKRKLAPRDRKIRMVSRRISDRIDAALPDESQAKRAKDARDYWSGSAHVEHIRDLSHWHGEGRWKDSTAWEQIGQDSFRRWQQLSIVSASDMPNRRMIEWGPGGGANAIRFAEVFSEIYGVDISQANLDECEKQLVKRGFAGFRQVLVDAERPDGSLTQVPSDCDFFLSTSVFQHFPSKEYGFKVLEVATALLRSGGTALIQIRYDDLNPKFTPKGRSYRRHAITFTSYSIGEFWNMTAAVGLKPQFVALEPNVNYAYFFLRKDTA